MRTAHRLTALLGGGLLAAGLAVGTALPAAATAAQAPRDERCHVQLDQGRGDRLDVHIRSDVRDGRARVDVDYDRGRSDRDTVRLDRRGDGDTTFRVPDRARRAHVEVTIRDRRDVVRCDDSIRLR